jgi:hypothetical protein
LPALPSWLDTFENVFFSWPPSVFTVAMIATEMPAAIRPYSMAVAPESSRRKRLRFRRLTRPLRHVGEHVAIGSRLAC